MIIRCKECKEVCGDMKTRSVIEEYLKGNFTVKCKNCGAENNYVTEQEETKTGIDLKNSIKKAQEALLEIENIKEQLKTRDKAECNIYSDSIEIDLIIRKV